MKLSIELGAVGLLLCLVLRELELELEPGLKESAAVVCWLPMVVDSAQWSIYTHVNLHSELYCFHQTSNLINSVVCVQGDPRELQQLLKSVSVIRC